MKNLTRLVLILVIISCQRSAFQYPETKKVDTIDYYFGFKVPDPYRWLEDQDSEDTKAWVKAQNNLTFNYLTEIPYRDKIRDRVTQTYDYKRISAPFKAGGRYFFYKNEGLQNQDVLYYKNSLISTPKLLIDPNYLSIKENISLTNVDISKDGKYIAYSISIDGSDWNEIHFKNINTREELEEKLKWIKFSNISWYKDGVFYSKYDAPEKGKELTNINTNQKVCYHKIGTSQEEDQIVFQNNDPYRMYYAEVTDDEKYILVYEREWTSIGNSLYIKNLNEPEDEFVRLTRTYDFEYHVVGEINDILYVRTNFLAPQYKLVKLDLNKFQIGDWLDIIPNQSNVLKNCWIVGESIVAEYMKDVHSLLIVYDLQGKLTNNIELPTIGTIKEFYGKPNDNIAFYSFSSYVFPTTVYKYDVKWNKSEVYFSPDVDFKSEEYETNLIFYKSKDRTEIPMYIVHKKDMKLDGTNPTLLYGYGGFNIVYPPEFKNKLIVWFENGGIYANAHIRGGGEYGKEWHLSGMKFLKHNAFNDYIKAAEYLINNKYTSPEHLAIQGGSNGGLLIGTVVNIRPELFKVALPAVGVMDMLRFHKFTIGGAWVPDYGCSDDSLQFRYLYSYSPLHNIQKRLKYPAIFATTADHDDRVIPAHSYKYIATIQEKYKGENPILIRIDTNVGHSKGRPTSKKIEEISDIYTFTFKNMNITPKY